MNWLMRALFGFHPMMIIEGEGSAGGGEPAGEAGGEVITGEGGDVISGAPSDGEGGEPGAAPAKDTPVATESAMLEGIKKALAPVDPEADKAAAAEAAKVTAKKKADEEFEKTLAGKAPEEVATARAAREAQAKKEAAAAEREATKGKKADDFQLSPQMKKHLSQEANQRFHTLHRYAKEKETEVAQLTEQFTAVSKARDEMMGLFTEHHVEPEDLGALLSYNRLVKTGDLAGALQVVETQRAALLKAMGREAPGVDLLEEFQDLQQRVKDSELSRADAVELANARRREAAQRQTASVRGQQQQGAQQIAKARQVANAEIDAWAAKMEKEDIDYKAKEAKVLAAIPEIVKEYPPHLWLKTMQRMYSAIEIVKPAVAAAAPLRPSGARPGNRQFTELTPEALRQGLGYPASSG